MGDTRCTSDAAAQPPSNSRPQGDPQGRGPTTKDGGGLPPAPVPSELPTENWELSTPAFIMPVVGPPIPRPLAGREQARAELEKARQAEMRRRCCVNCANSTRPAGRCFCAVLGQYPTLLVCTNCTEAPGVLMGVLADHVCRNFRLRGIPGVVYGVNPYNVGGFDEFITVDDLVTVAKVHASAVVDYLGAGQAS